MKGQKKALQQIFDQFPVTGNICILGSGRLNDIPIEHLCAVAESITFVDINIELTLSSISLINLSHNNLKYSSVDITSSDAAEQIGKNEYSWVISSLVLSQLQLAAEEKSTDEVTKMHLQLISNLLDSKGTAVLSGELTTYDKCRQDKTDIHELVSNNDFVKGQNPYKLISLLEFVFVKSLSLPKLFFGWQWKLRGDISFINYAIVFSKIPEFKSLYQQLAMSESEGTAEEFIQ